MNIEHKSNNSTSEQIELPKTIFLVEDEEVLSELTKEYLEMNGYRVFTAIDGEEAIELYRKHCDIIDIVVTDMGLPKLTGLEVLIEMNKIKPETKLIFASGYIEPELKSLMFQHGAKFFLYKPYQPNEILKVIKNILDELVQSSKASIFN